MKIVGIDPASAKGCTIFDPELGFNYRVDAGESDQQFKKNLSPEETRSYLFYLKEKYENLLICWDAPLNGFYEPGRLPTEKEYKNGAYTQRPIEKVLSKVFKKVPGVNTSGYAMLPHWSVSRALLGLPQVGPYDQREKLPFSLVTESKPLQGHWIIETHPAISLWLWSGMNEQSSLFPYKGGKRDKNTDQPKELLNLIYEDDLDHLEKLKSDTEKELKISNDMLDAYACYLVGKHWYKNSSAAIYGSTQHGAILLPHKKDLLSVVSDLLNKL